MEEHRERGGRGPRHGREVRREGGLLSRTGALRIAAVEARSVQGDGGRVAAGGPVHAPQAAAHRQARVRQTRVGEGLRGLVFAGAAVRETVARGASPPVGRVSGAQVASGRGAGRFRHGAGRGRRDRVDVHCLVVTFPYSNMRYCVALPGENAECVRAGLRTVFEHIGAVPLTLVLDNATGAGHRIAWDKVTVVHVFELFVEHYRLETRFCNPNSGNEKGSVENAVGFLRRNIMVPMPDAESHGQLTRYMLERCDAMAKETHYRKGAPIGGLFAGEKMDMQPLPAKPYDAIRWEVGKADKDGRVQIDGNYYLAGPSWRGWTLDVGLRAFDVTIRTQDGRTCARLPRVYGDSPATVRNPATLLPALSRKTHAWTDSTIRDDFPDKLRIAIDRMDAKTRRTTFRVIAKASAASGFEAAVRAGEHLVEQGHAIDEASVTTMARRIAAGEKPYEQSAPDLTGYDVFMKPRQPWERKEA